MLIWFLTYDRISEACPPVSFNNEDRVCLLDNEYQHLHYDKRLIRSTNYSKH